MGTSLHAARQTSAEALSFLCLYIYIWLEVSSSCMHFAYLPFFSASVFAMPSAMALPGEKTRLKVLPSVTVSASEEAIQDGFKTLGHRNIKVLSMHLDKITWKTASSKHLPAFIAVFPLLLQIFMVCKNGVIPASSLEKAGSVD